MQALKRAWLWVFRHHRCSSCGLPRPVWFRGDHTPCIEYELARLQRIERYRHEYEYGAWPADARRDDWGCMI